MRNLGLVTWISRNRKNKNFLLGWEKSTVTISIEKYHFDTKRNVLKPILQQISS